MEQNLSNSFTSDNTNAASFLGEAYKNNIGSDASYTLSSNPINSGCTGTTDFQTIKPANGKSVSTSRFDIPHSELLKMLYYLEGELQARDVVIAALRNDRVKHYISQMRVKKLQCNDPYAAIFRDKIALTGNLLSKDSSTQAAEAEMEIRQIIEQQMEQQYRMVSKQRDTHVRMVSILTESLDSNQRMLQELEEEKRKHEHDTAQGDDITYGLEMERTKLKQELESERQQLKKLEKDLKKLQETLDFERSRQKQIVLLLIAERKKILSKYIEEGKRSEDLAQIIAEEKQRSDTIAEGLEEESKKSLRMEEDLEKQALLFDTERKILNADLLKAEHRILELEQELAQLRNDSEIHKKQQNIPVLSNPAISTNNLVHKSRLNDEVSPLLNIAKAIQPIATATSVPVSVPTTGIARSFASGQSIRNTIAIPVVIPQQPSSCNVLISNESVNNCVTTMSAASPSASKVQPTATIQRAVGSKFSPLSTTMGNSQDQSFTVSVATINVPNIGARGLPPPIPPNKPIVPPKREQSISRIASVNSAATSVTSSGGTTVVTAMGATVGANSNIK